MTRANHIQNLFWGQGMLMNKYLEQRELLFHKTFNAMSLNDIIQCYLRLKWEKDTKIGWPLYWKGTKIISSNLSINVQYTRWQKELQQNGHLPAKGIEVVP